MPWNPTDVVVVVVVATIFIILPIDVFRVQDVSLPRFGPPTKLDSSFFFHLTSIGRVPSNLVILDKQIYKIKKNNARIDRLYSKGKREVVIKGFYWS